MVSIHMTDERHIVSLVFLPSQRIEILPYAAQKQEMQYSSKETGTVFKYEIGSFSPDAGQLDFNRNHQHINEFD